jgi:hypothetical protein
MATSQREDSDVQAYRTAIGCLFWSQQCHTPL